MASPPGSANKSTAAGSPLGGLHYLLIFSAFGLLGLVVIGPKYQELQADKEQQYAGIRRIQQREQQERLAKEKVPGAMPDPRFEPQLQFATQPDGKQSLIITLRPLMLLAAVAMLCAWAGLQWRRMQRTTAAAHVLLQPPTPSPHQEQPPQ